MKGKVIARTAKAALPPQSAPKRARYPALAHLPKTPLPRGVTYRHRTPGSSLKLIAFAAQGKYIDPGHPAVGSLSSSARGAGDGFTFHRWKSPTGSFNMVAAPSAFLFEPDERKWYPYLELSEKWEDKLTKKMKRNEGKEEEKVVPYWKRKKEVGEEQPLQDVVEGSEEVLPELCDAEGPDPMQAVERILERRRDVLSKAVPISLRFATNKAAMGGRPIYASKVRQRVRNAVSLIVTHGAKAKAVKKEGRSPVAGEEGREGQGEEKEPIQKRFELVCDLKEVEERKDMPGQGWILKDWTYLIFPTMNLYRMPIQDLVAELREALGSVWAKGMNLNKKWMKQSIRERKAAASAPSTVSADRSQLSRGLERGSSFQDSVSLTGDKPRRALSRPEAWEGVGRKDERRPNFRESGARDVSRRAFSRPEAGEGMGQRNDQRPTFRQPEPASRVNDVSRAFSRPDSGEGPGQKDDIPTVVRRGFRKPDDSALPNRGFTRRPREPPSS